MSKVIAGKPRNISGWKKDRPDHRDMVFMAPPSTSMPSSADNTKNCSPIEDQGDLGSCTANASTSCMEALLIKEGKNYSDLSRLYVYYYTRKIEGTPPGEDSGAYIRNVMKALAYFGASLEMLWPYKIEKYATGPNYNAIRDAQRRRVTRYMRCPTLPSIKQTLAQGFTIVGGFSVPADALTGKSEKTGIIEFPRQDEEIIGGHAVHFVGYDDATKLLKFQNSWGTKWGDKGFGYLPYAFVEKAMADDFWTIRAGLMP